MPEPDGRATTSTAWVAGMPAVAAGRDVNASPKSAEFFQDLWTNKKQPPRWTLAVPDLQRSGSPSGCPFTLTLKSGQFVDNNPASQCV